MDKLVLELLYPTCDKGLQLLSGQIMKMRNGEREEFRTWGNLVDCCWRSSSQET